MNPATQQDPADSVDGRRQRGQDNRARIVAAMMNIVREGQIAPSAEQVAARADVGLRTVFRHFQDMDSLYREMSLVIQTQVSAISERPLPETGWPERLLELVRRRAMAFETIGPFRRAADAFRHRSRFLGADADRLATELRAKLEQVLPQEVAADPLKVETLDLLMSFEAWSRLRREQGLSVEQAQRVVETLVRRVIGQTEA
jgi:AcrR family transcriptional regulator